METTSFIENVVQLIEQRHTKKIDFSIFQRNDPKITDAMEWLNNLGRYKRHILCDDLLWGSFLNNKSDIIMKEACLFAYYKPEFLTEYLNGEVYDNLLFKLNNTLLSVDITLLPPSVNNMDFNFSVVDEKTLRCGFSCFGSAYLDLIGSVAGKSFQDFSDFIIKASDTCSAEDITSLIKCGGADCFGHTRKAMLESFENFTADKSKNIEILHDEEFDKQELGLMEFDKLNWAYSSSWFLDEDTGELIYMGRD